MAEDMHSSPLSNIHMSNDLGAQGYLDMSQNNCMESSKSATRTTCRVCKNFLGVDIVLDPVALI